MFSFPIPKLLPMRENRFSNFVNVHVVFRFFPVYLFYLLSNVCEMCSCARVLVWLSENFIQFYTSSALDDVIKTRLLYLVTDKNKCVLLCTKVTNFYIIFYKDLRWMLFDTFKIFSSLHCNTVLCQLFNHATFFALTQIWRRYLSFKYDCSSTFRYYMWSATCR